MWGHGVLCLGTQCDCNEETIVSPLTESEYNRLYTFRDIISRVAAGGNTSNGDVWWMCYQIKLEKTGEQSRSDCGACKIELITEFENLMQQYEKNKEAQNGD